MSIESCFCEVTQVRGCVRFATTEGSSSSRVPVDKFLNLRYPCRRNTAKRGGMWTDRVYLGPAPSEEDCAQVGRDDYEERARRECMAYIEAIRKVVGMEPEGARLRVARQAHDYGSYLEVVCEYDGNSPDAANYAARCDEQAPTTWEAAGMTTPSGTGTASQQSGKRYVGTRTPDECVVIVINSEGAEELLDPRFDLRNHSPDGFNWGYSGSGPAQLALALLADALGDDERAQDIYQDFKFKVVARFDTDQFELSQIEIQQTVARLEAERGNKRG